MIDSIAFSGIISPGLYLTLEKSTLSQNEREIRYAVTAPSNMVEGTFSIEWTVTDSSTECGDIYGDLTMTYIQVLECHPTEVAVPYSIVLYGKSTTPLLLSLTYPPAEELIVTMTIVGTHPLIVSPSRLTFTQFETEHYFNVTTENNNTLNYFIEYELTGTDHGAYAKPYLSSVSGSDIVDDISILTPVLTLDVNSASISVETAFTGLVYWYFKCSQEEVLPVIPLDEIVSLFNENLESPEGSSTQVYSVETPMKYFQEKIQDHCSTVEYGAAPYEGVEEEFKIGGLVDSTHYTFGVYYVNTVGTVLNEDPFLLTGSTKSVDRIKVITLVFLGTDSILDDSTVISSIKCILATHMHVAFNLLEYHTSQVIETNSTNGISGSTTIEYFLTYDRFDTTTDAGDYVKLGDSTEIKQELETIFDNDSSLTKIIYSVADFNEGKIGVFTFGPLVNDTYSFSGTVSANGFWCVECIDLETNDIGPPTGWQVFYGLTAKSNKADGFECTKVKQGVEAQVTLTGLAGEKEYQCSHALCNLNSHIPACKLWEKSSESEDDAGIKIMVSGLLFFFFL